MVSITLSVPEETKEEMAAFPEINWSAVAREAITRKIELLRRANKLLSNSKLTEEDALAFGREVTKRAAKRYA